jgi:two-component sensor histidine kinase/DNA-binding NarL/FixJ family response regulator
MRILIVDDNKVNLSLLENLLKNNGYKVVSAENGAEALAKLRANGFGLIISDILMPVMDGFQLCREAKKVAKLKRIPFVFYTATYTDEKDKELALKMGADKYLRKPLKPDEFIKIIQAVIRDMEEGKIGLKKPALGEEKEVFKLYSERLVNKLEKKMLDLEKEIIKRKRVEEELRKHRDHLEGMVAQRTAEVVTANKQLKQDITRRKRAEKKLKASVKEKEVLLKEIHHRVKNNLQIIYSILNLQSGKIKDRKILNIFRQTQSRIRSMGLIHEKLYQSKDLAKLDIAQYIRSLTVHLFHTYKIKADEINLNTDIDDVFFDIDTTIPCGLIINELVSNSLKHAFPGGRKGEVTVKMHKDQKGHYTLIVRDTGIGFPRDVDFRKTDTLGMKLVSDLVKQLKGTIELIRIKGTEFKIVF